MKRARWVPWNVLTALSLLACLATVALWVRSYRVRDIVGFGWKGGDAHLAQSIRGRLHVLTHLGGGYMGGVLHQSDRLSPLALWNGAMSGYPRPGEVRWRCGFVWQTYDRSYFGNGNPYSMTNRLIVVPYAFPAGVFALAPLAWAAGVRRRVGLIDLMVLVAAVAVVLAIPIALAVAMNRSMVGPG